MACIGAFRSTAVAPEIDPVLHRSALTVVWFHTGLDVPSGGPYSTGTSLHGTPVRTRKRMPSINCRRDQTGGRPALIPFGSNGSNTAHCSSVHGDYQSASASIRENGSASVSGVTSVTVRPARRHTSSKSWRVRSLPPTFTSMLRSLR